MPLAIEPLAIELILRFLALEALTRSGAVNIC